MPTAKKKKSTKTAKKATSVSRSHKKVSTRTTRNKGITPKEKWHVYIVTALSIMVGVLLCTDAAIMIMS